MHTRTFSVIILAFGVSALALVGCPSGPTDSGGTDDTWNGAARCADSVGLYVQSWAWYQLGAVDQFLGTCAEHGIDRIYVECFTWGDADEEQWHGTDGSKASRTVALSQLDDLASQGDGHGINVYAWIHCNPIHYNEAQKVDFWNLDPEDGQEWSTHKERLRGVLGSLATTCVDGVLFDYIRYPNDGVSDESTREAKVEDLLRSLYEACTSEGWFAKSKLGAAVFPDLGGSSSAYVRRTLGQDYERMAPYLGFLSPMTYHIDSKEPTSWIGEVREYAEDQVSGSGCQVRMIVQAYEETAPDHAPRELPGADEVRNALEEAISGNSGDADVFSAVHVSDEEWDAIADTLCVTPEPQTPVTGSTLDEDFEDKVADGWSYPGEVTPPHSTSTGNFSIDSPGLNGSSFKYSASSACASPNVSWNTGTLEFDLQMPSSSFGDFNIALAIDDTDNYVHLGLFPDGGDNGTDFIQVIRGGQQVAADSRATTLQAGSAHQVRVVKQSGSVSLYLDGASSAYLSLSSSQIPTGALPFYFRFWTSGSIDNVVLSP